MDLLRGEFEEYFILHSGPVNWWARSCDLMPLDHFLKAMLKHLFVRYRPKCWKEYAKIGLKRMDNLKCSRGQHLHEIIVMDLL